MRDRRSLSDQDLDRLLAGKAPSGGDSVDRELAAFVRDVRAAFLKSPDTKTERVQLAAAMEASRLTIDKGDPVVRPASKAGGPDRQASGLPKWRRRTVFSSLFASLTAKIAGVAIAATAAAGGLAATGALPGPAQQAVSQAASTIGIHVPSGEHGSSGSDSSASSKPAHPAPTSTVGDENAAPTSTVAPVSSTASEANHGACVSYAADVAASLGMTGSLKGQFVSAVAQDSSAVSAKVSEGGKPDAACLAAIAKAKAAATSPGQSGDTHGKPGVTATATPGPGNNPNGFGQDNHPGPTDHPGSNPGSGSNPAGVTPTAHQGKP